VHLAIWIHPEEFPHPRHQPCHSERMAPEVKEVIVDADALQPEKALEDVRELPLHAIPRLHVLPLEFLGAVAVRRWEGPAVDLA
jgi:hypothetical protein